MWKFFLTVKPRPRRSFFTPPYSFIPPCPPSPSSPPPPPFSFLPPPPPSFSTKSLEEKALWKRFPCPVCNQGFNSPTAVADHMRMLHKRHLKTCKVSCGCGIRFPNKKEKKEYQEICIACEYDSMSKCREGETEKYRQNLKNKKNADTEVPDDNLVPEVPDGDPAPKCISVSDLGYWQLIWNELLKACETAYSYWKHPPTSKRYSIIEQKMPGLRAPSDYDQEPTCLPAFVINSKEPFNAVPHHSDLVSSYVSPVEFYKRNHAPIGKSVEEFQKDTNIWEYRVDEYWKQMISVIYSFRNVMDMNSNLVGLSARLKDKDDWVINVAPVNASARLKIIYDRGLIGTVHDWCESYITYPHTYDLLHAWSVFSEIKARGYSSEDLLIEMDPILRPEGFVIIGDEPSVINHVRKFLASLKWDGWSSEVEPSKDTLSTCEERVYMQQLW